MAVPGPRDAAAAPRLFPVVLDLRGRPVVVVGGGSMAEAKVSLLLESGAVVKVVSPDLSPQLETWKRQGRLSWVDRRFVAEDLAPAFLVVAATNDPKANARIFAYAEESATLVNAVDDVPSCSVMLPSVHRDGQLIVAVSTSGKAPAVAVRLRERISRLTVGYGSAVELLGGFRDEIKSRFATFEERRRVWYRVVDSEAFQSARRGDDTAATIAIESILGASEEVR